MFYVFKCLSYLQITFFNAEMKQSCSGQECSLGDRPFYLYVKFADEKYAKIYIKAKPSCF